MFIAFCMRSTVSIYNLARACSINAICRCQQLRLKIGIFNCVTENNNVMCAFEIRKIQLPKAFFHLRIYEKEFLLLYRNHNTYHKTYRRALLSVKWKNNKHRSNGRRWVWWWGYWMIIHFHNCQVHVTYLLFEVTIID